MEPSGSLAWNLYIELRKEILSTQSLRSRTIEIKITIVGGAISLFLANRGKLGDDRLLALPAFVATFFDFLIASYSFAIKRKGDYLRTCLEPRLRREFSWPFGLPLWEEFLSAPERRQMFSVIANMGLTILACLPGMFVLLRQPVPLINAAIVALLLLLVGCVAWIYGHLDYFASLRRRRSKRVNSIE